MTYTYSFYFWVEVFTLLVCIFCYRNFTLNRYKFFLPYLAIIVFYEFGTIHKWFAIHKSNLWIVNFELTFEFLFYSLFALSLYKPWKKRRLPALVILGCFLFTMIDIFFIQGVHALCTIAILLQHSILITLVCHFFYKKMHEFEKNTSLLKDPDFWVFTGLLFFFLAEFMFFASFTNMAYKKLYTYHLLFVVITNVANLILYSFLSIAFLCFRQMKKISY